MALLDNFVRNRLSSAEGRIAVKSTCRNCGQWSTGDISQVLERERQHTKECPGVRGPSGIYEFPVHMISAVPKRSSHHPRGASAKPKNAAKKR